MLKLYKTLSLKTRYFRGFRFLILYVFISLFGSARKLGGGGQSKLSYTHSRPKLSDFYTLSQTKLL